MSKSVKENLLQFSFFSLKLSSKSNLIIIMNQIYNLNNNKLNYDEVYISKI